MKTSRDVNETILRILLRYMGLVTMLALVAVFMPYSWMNATHRWLGLGDLPATPVVGYLARSLSLFYALLGGLLWFLSGNPRRHRAVLLYLGAAFVVFGLVCFGIDFVEASAELLEVGRRSIHHLVWGCAAPAGTSAQ